MGNKKYYEILGVKENATVDEIRKAYKKMTKIFHPDKQHGKTETEKKQAEEDFKVLNEAHTVLTDPEKRSLYDRFGEDLGKSQGFGGGFNDVDLSDIINQHFSGFGRQHFDPRQNSNLQITMSLTFEELHKFEGVNKKFTYSRHICCDHCNSTGIGPDGKKIPCPTCKGHGILNQQMGGNMFIQTQCPSCHGEKYKIDKPCVHCDGGYKKITETIDINVVAGTIFDQMVIPQKGNEMMYNGMKHIGDLYVRVKPLFHKDFEIDQHGNLHIETDVNILDCIIGGNIQFKCIDGTEKQFKLKVGTRDKEQFRMGGLGIAKNSTDRTNLYVHVNHKFPTELTDKEIEILNDLKTKQNFK